MEYILTLVWGYFLLLSSAKGQIAENESVLYLGVFAEAC